MTRPKLMTAAALAAILAAGAATALVPLASAQRPVGPAQEQLFPPGAAPGATWHKSYGPAVVHFGSPSSWEYKFVPRKTDSLEAFQRLLEEHGAAGWEYCGTESLSVKDPAKKEEWRAGPTIVFKRPKAPQHSSGGAAPPPSDYVPRAEQPARFKEAQPDMQPDISVIRVGHAEAAELAKVLSELFAGRNCRFGADPRTNSLLVQADESSLKTVRSVLEKIDQPTVTAPVKRPSGQSIPSTNPSK